jgi:O-antigen/teichoic acid export membrane protein
MPDNTPRSPAGVRAARFVLDVVLVGAVQLVDRLRGLLLLPIIVKSLGLAAYGVWTQFFTTAAVVRVLVALQLSEALVRYAAGASREEQREYYYSLLFLVAGTGLLVGLPLTLFSRRTAELFLGGAEYANLALYLGVYICLSAADGLSIALFRALLHLRLAAILSTGTNLLEFGLAALVLYFRRDLTLAVQVVLLAQSVEVVVIVGIAVRLIGFRLPAFRLLRKCLSYSLPLLPTNYSSVILASSDRFVIAYLLGPAAVGAYAAAYNMAALLARPSDPLQVALLPTVSRLWDTGGREEAKKYLSYSLRFILSFVVPGLVGLWLVAPPVLTLLVTADTGRLARAVVPLAGAGIALAQCQSIFGLLLLLHEKTGEVAAVLMFSAAIHLSLNFMLIPWLGVVGGAVATLLGYGLQAALIGWRAWRRDRFQVQARFLLIPAAASLPILLVVAWLKPATPLELAVAVAASAVAYFVALILLGGLDVSEIHSLWRLLARPRPAALE